MKKCIKIVTVGLLALGLTACGKDTEVVESNVPAIEYVYEEEPVETQREELVPEVTEPVVEEATPTEETTVEETETVEETPTEETETVEESEIIENSSITEEVTNNVTENVEIANDKVETTPKEEETVIYQPSPDLALTVLIGLARDNNLVLNGKALSYFSSNFGMNENTTYSELISSIQAAYDGTEDFAKDFILDVIRNNQ